MRLERRLLIGAILTAGACSSPTTPTPGGSNPPSGGTSPGQTVVELKSFTATPATITEGDELTLTWQGQNGAVSLAQKGAAPFVAGLPASASHLLKPGAPGYPASPGTVVYEAAIGDVAKRLETTVTVNRRAPLNHDPTVTVTASPTGCHPRHWSPESCSVRCSAAAQDADGDALGYAWSGCAAGSGSTATCIVPRPGSHDCTVTVTDGKGGSATGSATVQGTNEAPGITNACWSGGGGCNLTTLAANWTFTGDAPTLRFLATDDDPDPAESIAACSAVSLGTPRGCTVIQCRLANANGRFYVEFNTLGPGRTCTLEVTLTDDWGKTHVESFSIPVV